MSHYVVLGIHHELPLAIATENHFDTAHEAALYMWGRSAGRYLIFKNNELAYLFHLYSDITDLEEYLKDIEHPPIPYSMK